MPRHLVAFAAAISTLVPGFAIAAKPEAAAPSGSLTIEPAEVELSGAGAVRGLLISVTTVDGRQVDVTNRAEWRSSNPNVATVNRAGYVQAAADGQCTITVDVGDRTASIPVVVRDSAAVRPVHFQNDVIPVLSRFGCNSSGCHGKAEGQNGFKLSVFGFDPRADFEALTKEGRGRRVQRTHSGQSLLLTKISGQVPHGGGVRIASDSIDYRTLEHWIDSGAEFGAVDAPTVAGLRVVPRERILLPGESQQLRVVATYSDGREVDVSQLASFQSNNDGLATVDKQGFVQIGESPGHVAVMAGFMGAVDTFQALIPRREPLKAASGAGESNFIDRYVNDRLGKLRIAPSPAADDAEFMRRVYLDIVGTLPTADEARRFLNDKQRDKRATLVNALLERPEYADYWSLIWSDLLRVDRQSLGHKSAYAYYRWIHRQVADNRPFDRFAADLIMARGPLAREPQGHFYQVVSNPGEMASTLSQVFLGVRIACAECHHHPYDRWSQTNFHGMRAFFQQVQRKSTSRGDVLLTAGDPATTHPRSGETIFAHALGTTMPDASPEGDRRTVLADWMASPENPWFARNIANRMWAHFTGRGLVEPVDDFRDTNPPSNPELLDALAGDLVDSGFDVKQLIRTITASRTYQRSSEPNETNELDEQNYSRALFRRMTSEVMFDAVCQVTGVPEKFRGAPYGFRAIQLWDSSVDHYFLKLFGRPNRTTACECERTAEPNISQVMHLLNSPEIQKRLSHESGTIARLTVAYPDDNRLIEEIYLTCFNRYPTDDEARFAADYLKSTDRTRRQSAEDLTWSLLNSLEFVFNH